MNEKNLLRILSEIDEKYILEAEEYSPSAHNRHYYKRVIAAILVVGIVLGSMAAVFHYRDQSNENYDYVAYEESYLQFIYETDDLPVQSRATYSEEYTKAIQLLLIRYSRSTSQKFVETGEVYGEYGPGTEAAIKDFQKKMDLPCDGVCSANTWAALKSYGR